MLEGIGDLLNQVLGLALDLLDNVRGHRGGGGDGGGYCNEGRVVL